jgi:hypothetical protein
MRTLNAAEAAAYATGSTRWRCTVEVADAAAVWRDLTTLPTFNAVKSVAIREDVDGPGPEASVTFYRNLDNVSLSPLAVTSPVNRTTPFDAGGSFSALIDVNRRLRITLTMEPEGGAGVTGHVLFDGVVSSWDLSSGETVTVECRGQYAELQDRFFEEEFVFAFGAALEASAFRVWRPSTGYSIGDRVIPTDAKANGRHYSVTASGTSGTTEPTWPTSGTVTDGGVTHSVTGGGLTTPTGGYPVESVLTTMARSVIPSGSARFGDSGTPTTIAVFTPVSPGWAINAFQVRRENVWNEMEALAQQIGWELRWRFDSGTSAWRLTLRDPDRAKVTPDRVFAFPEVREYSSVGLAAEDIRNVIRVVYSDALDRDAQGRARRKWVDVTNATSVTRYGRRYMEIGEASSSSIDSSAEALTMANAILSDLAFPTCDLSAQVALFPWVQIGDLYEFPPDGRRFTAAQKLAVVSYTHTIDDTGRLETSLGVRGQPSTGANRWHTLNTQIDPSDLHRFTERGNFGNLTLNVQNNLRGARLNLGGTSIGLRAAPREFEVHVGSTAGFTPSAATRVATGAGEDAVIIARKPGANEWARAVPINYNATRIVRGEPSEAVAIAPAFVEPLDLDPEKFRADLPPNGSFESSFDGFATPPAHWSLLAGGWKTDVDMASGDSFDGAAAVQWATTSGTFGLQSAWFPVTGGDEYQAQFALRRVSGDGNVRMSVEWASRTKSSLGTDTVDRATNGFTSWGLVDPARLTAPVAAAFARVTIARATAGTWSFRVDAVRLINTGKPWRGATAESWWASSDWADYGGIYQVVQARLDDAGRVHLRGLIQTTTGSGPTHILTLPVGLRPKAYELFSVITAKTDAGRLDVYDSGQVHLVAPSLDIAGEFVSLSGVSFDTR